MRFSFVVVASLLLAAQLRTSAQHINAPKELIQTYTSQYKGERFPDGRPKVPDDLVKRLKDISLEEAWGVLRNEGYTNQFEAGWMRISPGKVLAGRVLTAQYMPSRPDMENPVKEKGKAENRKGAPNSWPIDQLTENDVYVADGFGKLVDGTLIGDNLGNSIYAKSKTGVVFDGSVRDLEGLEEIEGFTGFVRGFDPSFIKDMLMTGINYPIRIGRATVVPGDLVLGKTEGVIFIPAHLAEKVITSSEWIALTDDFGHQMLREGKYTPGEIDMKWSPAIVQTFRDWLKAHPEKVKMSAAQLEERIKKL
ncbi:RraA family protein [Siphonobacter curvatus]|uniref:Dimethylmenaquinone methyltransferase n=1 Tax=Siphonobacter curvatus TaxID=2094562 RepID=A0A2S7IFK6_9BACT|nr:dimethylmenaquinone methyltransferase [Siphonobacter curvatus]PQA54094.1 dimethylmenaquinone methyltransferase [Siphonobacter curvatus]